GLPPAMCRYSDPALNTTEFGPLAPVPGPNGLPLKPAPAMHVAPALNTSAPASTAVTRCEPPARFSVPNTVPPAPLAIASVTALGPGSCSVEPAATLRSSPAFPVSDSVAVAPAWSVTFVLPLTSSWPIVCDVTPVAIVVAPLLKISTSLAVGRLRAGVQFAAVANDAVPLWFHVYVVWLKFAVMLLFAVMTNVSGLVTPVVSPLQPANTQPAAGVAVSWIDVPCAYVTWFGAGVTVPLPTVDSVSVYWLIANDAAMVWSACTAGNVKFVTAPTDEPFTSTSCTWKPKFGVIVNDGVAPSATATEPLGAMEPFGPALAVTVQPVIEKLAWLESEPMLPVPSCASTRTRAWFVSTTGSVHANVPLFAMPAAIAVGNVAPPLVESARSTFATMTLSVAVHVMLCTVAAPQLSPPTGDVIVTTGGVVSGVPL